MSKGKDEGGPYRAQGPGVPPDSPPREVPDPIFAEVLGQVLRGGLRPPMKRIEPVKVRWVPVTYTVEGKAGELQQVSRPIYFRFRAEEFFAMDTSSRLSHGTVIENVFHGAALQFFSLAEPVAHFCGRLHFYLTGHRQCGFAWSTYRRGFSCVVSTLA